MPKVSIVVPVWNVEPYIRKCLESLSIQTLNDIEVIIVNDGTEDNSQKIIDKYVKKDKRFSSYIKKNGGLSDARNYGMKYAKGEYLAFVDSDDYVDADMFEKMYAKAVEIDADLVECDFIWEYPSRQRIDRSHLNKDRIVSIRVAAWNKLYRRKLVEKYKIGFPFGLRYEDIPFCYKLIPHIKKIGYVPEPFYHYIQRSDSIANTQNERVGEIYQDLELVLDYYRKENIYKKHKDELEFIYMRYILSSSFLRTIRIKDKKVRLRVLKEGYDLLTSKFPKWRQNRFIKNCNILKRFYYKTMNRFMYNFYSVIFRIVGFDRWIA